MKTNMKTRFLSLLLVIVMICFLLPATAFAADTQEDEDTTGNDASYNGHTYQLYDEYMPWNEAKIYCESLGGHLVTITDANEQKFINTLIENANKNCYWIGATSVVGSWSWVTGELFSYTNWKTVEPNNEGSKEDVAVIITKINGASQFGFSVNVGNWNDVMNSGYNGNQNNSFYSPDSLGFICEWDDDIEVRDKYLSIDINNAVSYNGHTYRLYDEYMPWNEAKTYCESLGGHLVTITDANEQKFINTLIENANKNCYWIGATSVVGSWSWVTGELFSYTNWKTVEPNNEGSKEDVVLIITKINGASQFGFSVSVGDWNDVMNSGYNGNQNNSFYSPDSLGFICEWDDDIEV